MASPFAHRADTVTIEHPDLRLPLRTSSRSTCQDRAPSTLPCTLLGDGQNEEYNTLNPNRNFRAGQVVDSKRSPTLRLRRNFAQLALLSAGTAPSDLARADEGG